MKIKEAIREQAHPKLMPLLLRELPRLEAAQRQITPDHPERAQVTRALTVMYGQMNRLLATACLVMGYPLRQWEWADSNPLTMVARTYPMVESTDWFQSHLALIPMAPTARHLWTDLTMFEGEITTSEPNQAFG